MTEETELGAAERRVREGETNVARQMEIVGTLSRAGYTGGRAERLLAEFEANLAGHRKRLADLQGEKN